jgi:hypothetical protein
MTEKHSAKRAHKEANGKNGIGGYQGGSRIFCREIEIADGPGEKPVDRKIVPFHHIAGDAGRDHPPA